MRNSLLRGAGPALALTLLAGPSGAETPPEMDADAILRVTEGWKDRVFVVVADGGPARVDVEQVLADPSALFRKRRVGCAVRVGHGRLLLTTASVAGTEPEVELFDDGGRHTLARVLGTDRYFDLALLEAVEDLPGDPGAPLVAEGPEAPAGVPCLVLGAAYGRSLSATLGRTGGTIEIEPGGLPVRVHRVLAPIYPGDSGAPVLDAGGRFVGIVTGVSAPGSPPLLEGTVGEIDLDGSSQPAGSVGFAVPAWECRRAWEDLRRYGSLRRGYLGVQIAASDEGGEGARILGVVPGGPADRTGIRRGDLVTTFGERFVTNARQLCALVAATAPEHVVDVRVLRGGREHLLTVEIGRARRLPGYHRVPPAQMAGETTDAQTPR